jgi:hypothetical protein
MDKVTNLLFSFSMSEIAGQFSEMTGSFSEMTCSLRSIDISEQSIPYFPKVPLASLRVGCKKFEVAKNIFPFKFRNQKSRRDDMPVENTSPPPKNPVGMTCRYRKIFNSLNEDRHVIPTGFLIAFVLFSTGMSSLRDFIHSKTERCFLHNIRYFLQSTLRDLLYVAGTRISRSQIATLNKGRGYNIKYPPFAFTELGVAMLSSVLNSPAAIETNRDIMRVFVAIRQYALGYTELYFQRSKFVSWICDESIHDGSSLRGAQLRMS